MAKGIKALGLKSAGNKLRGEEKETNQLRIIEIKGPFNEKNEIVNYISRKHEYYYIAVFNKNPSKEQVSKLNWSVSYDDKKSKDSFYLFSGGTILKLKEVRIKLNSVSSKNKFKLYAYFTSPSDNIFLEVKYKKSITFFIGGAGDKETFYKTMPEPSYIMERVEIDFNKYKTSANDHISYYLGYNEVIKIQEKIISKIPNKEGTQINIVGHSLGGWNGAHLSGKLYDKGYKINTLITLDPVGTEVWTKSVAAIFKLVPIPVFDIWINIYSEPIDKEADDYVADIGGQWIPDEESVTIIRKVKLHHREAGKMFNNVLEEGNDDTEIDYGNVSPADILSENINSYLNKR